MVIKAGLDSSVTCGNSDDVGGNIGMGSWCPATSYTRLHLTRDQGWRVQGWDLSLATCCYEVVNDMVTTEVGYVV